MSFKKNIIEELSLDKVSFDILMAIDELFENHYIYIYPEVLDYIIDAGPHILKYWIGIVLKTYTPPSKNVLETFDNLGIKYLVKKEEENVYLNPERGTTNNFQYTPTYYYHIDNLTYNVPSPEKRIFYRIYLLIPKDIIDYEWVDKEVEKYFDEDFDTYIQAKEEGFDETNIRISK